MTHCLNYEVLCLLLNCLSTPQTILFDFGQNLEHHSLVYTTLIFYIFKFSSDTYTPPRFLFTVKIVGLFLWSE